jgi:hypothetical protein
VGHNDICHTSVRAAVWCSSKWLHLRQAARLPALVAQDVAGGCPGGLQQRYHVSAVACWVDSLVRTWHQLLHQQQQQCLTLVSEIQRRRAVPGTLCYL